MESLQLANSLGILRAGATFQAQINGYDNEGVEVDEEGNACWWTSTEGKDANTLYYVNSEGKFDVEPMMRDYIGIRPAIWVELKKKV